MEAIAACLAREILAGKFEPDDNFPREMDLCKRFDASRNRLRNALAQLVGAGLLERTAGRRTLVRPMSEWQLLDPLMSDWISGLKGIKPALMREIYAFRLVRRARCQRPGGRPRPTPRTSQGWSAPRGNGRDRQSDEQQAAHSEFDVAFHEAIYRATHNLVWAQLGQPAAPFHQPVDRVLPAGGTTARLGPSPCQSRATSRRDGSHPPASTGHGAYLCRSACSKRVRAISDSALIIRASRRRASDPRLFLLQCFPS
ncbi:FadR/GntR family transcriptional regulator [Cobetia marina]